MRCKAGMLGGNREIPWDITTAAYAYDMNVNARERVPEALVFSPDGLKLFVVGSFSRAVVAYSMTVAWQLSTASFVASKAISNPTANATWAIDAMAFKPDGTKLFVSGSGYLQEYSLSTPWDVSSATHAQTVSIGAKGIVFDPDGNTFFTASRSTTNTVTKRSLSVAWDISSASVSQQISLPLFAEDVFFSSDGLLMFLVTLERIVYKYSLSTPWDIGTAALSQTRSLGDAPVFLSQGIAFREDGSAMYVCGNESGNPPTYSPIVQYSIG